VTKPIVAIIGRQNVGKSTLLNRLAGKPLAIIADFPGTTRDRIFADVSWESTEFTIIDTGGIEFKSDSSITQEVQEQAELAIEEADVIIFMVDVRDGLITTDREIADVLRKTNKPMVLAINKADNNKFETEAAAFYELGLGEPFSISALRGRGTADLMDKIVALLPSSTPAEEKQQAMKVAIVGRPNAGKSMLLNTLLGKERAIVDDKPGTTRDALDTLLDFNEEGVLLIDTAGIRRRGRIEKGIEQYSVIRALRAIDRADITLLVLDATELFAAQDLHIAGYIQQAAKGIVLIVNKWDLVPIDNTDEYSSYIRSRIRFMPYAPVLYISAKFSQGTEDILPLVSQVYQERHKRLSTPEVNNIIQRAAAFHTPPRVGKRQLKIFYATQAEVNPPTFVIFVNDASLVHFSYHRYLENKLRESYGFAGTPLRLLFKSRKNYDNS